MTYLSDKPRQLIKRGFTSYRPLVILLLRGVLLLLMLCGVVLLLWPVIESHFEDNKNNPHKLIISNEEEQQFSSKDYTIDTHTHIDEPVLYGKDKNNQPFTIKAKSATEEDQNHVSLQEVSGYINLTTTHRWIKIIASKADYFPKEKRLEVNGVVTVETSDGYYCRTSKATVTHADYYKIVGNQPVTAKNGQTTIDAKGFVIDEKDQSIVFTGRVRSTHIGEVGGVGTPPMTK